MDTAITAVRPATYPSTCRLRSASDEQAMYVPDDLRVLVDDRPGGAGHTFENAGPRKLIAVDPENVRTAILTAGGLCPGLNDVIRALVLGLHHHYGVSEDRILGIPNGYAGLMRDQDIARIRALRVDEVKYIHQQGGSILGSARIKPDVPRIVDTLQRLGIDILFCLGGDGTQRGNHAIHLEAQKRGYPLICVGIPKTIDNDILWVDRTFGFDTAVQVARESVICAHTEAESAPNGVGLVKLMGRDSGFIAASAAVATGHTNFVLVPEVPFDLDGEHGFLACLQRRLDRRGHAVVVVAEGAGQEFFAGQAERRDASGNKLHDDIGVFLKERIVRHFRERELEVNVKYIDPSYIIRSTPTDASDAIFCQQLGACAVHAGMAGKGDLIVGLWHGRFTHVPIPLATAGRKRLEPHGALWATVLHTTGQPVMKRSTTAFSAP